MNDTPAASWLDFNLAAYRATEGRPAGECHLVGLVKRGPHGLAIATAALVVVGGEDRPFRMVDSERLSFETFPEARAFISAWTWYRVIHNRKAERNGKL
jgi:hypothetical protein